MAMRLEIYAGPDREHSTRTVAASGAPRRLLQSRLPFAAVGDFRNWCCRVVRCCRLGGGRQNVDTIAGPMSIAPTGIAAGLGAILPVSNVIWSWG
jgi:hypothetical protein